MSRTKWIRYAMFALIYFAQGAIVSYFSALNPLYLQGFQLEMSTIGLIGTIAMIPFVLKIFLGMLSDSVNLFGLGHRRPYIVIGLVVQVVCLLLVPLIDPGQSFALFAGLAFILMTGQALYDTCTDGLALDTTPTVEEGRIQGIMVGGRALGVIITASIIGTLAHSVGWTAVFIALAGLTLLAMPLVFLVKEPPRPAERKFEWSAFKAFTKPSLITLGLLGALYSLITNGANEILNPFLRVEYGINLQTAGFVTTVWGLGVVVGGLTGGWLTDRIGQRNSVILASLLSLAAIAALATISGVGAAYAFAALFGLAYGYYETVYFAISMNSTDPRIAASMFAILMAVANIGTAVGLGLAGSLVDTIGYRVTFLVLAGLNLLAFLLLPVIFKNGAKAGA